MKKADQDAWYFNIEQVAKRLTRNRHQYLFLFLFLIVVGSLVSYRTEVNQHTIERAAAESEARNAAMCADVNRNSVRLNAFLNTVITSVKESPTLSEVEKKQRIEIYSSIIQDVPTCQTDNSNGSTN